MPHPRGGRRTSPDPASVRALVDDPSDVLVSTVGPFARLGRVALDAAIDQGCAYVDSTGEPSFVRAVFEQDGDRARQTGARLLTAFGYDYVPGNLAGALALRDCGGGVGAASRVDVGYFVRGASAKPGGGTRASAMGMITEPSFAFRNGRVVDSGTGSVATFDVGGRALDGLPIGGSEHFALPRLDPRPATSVSTWAGPDGSRGPRTSPARRCPSPAACHWSAR